MSFQSYEFILLFLPVLLIGYYGSNKTGKPKAGMLFLIVMSLWFYGRYGIAYLLLLAASVCVNQLLVCGMEKAEKKGRKALFALALVFNIGLLLYFKYCDFFIENINRVCKTDFAFLELALPAGISFYTFRQLAYVIDCFGKKTKPYPFLDYAAFALFFPLMIQGPIARYDEVIAQFREEERKKLSYVHLSRGFYAFAKGLAKKVLLADTLAPMANMVFADLWKGDSVYLFMGALFYTFQIYFDFSGYCDMAYGIGQMLHLELPINFNSPYKAESVSAFWERWHMTLTKFFTTYVFIPLGGSRRGIFRTCLNTMIVFLVSGFWHGANWTFVLWGAINGAFLIIERFLGKWLVKIPKFIRIGVTFVITIFLWGVFRVPSVAHAKVLVMRIFEGSLGPVSTKFTDYFNELTEVRILQRFGFGGLIEAYPALPLIGFTLLCFVIVWCFKNTKEKTEAFTFEGTKKCGLQLAGTVVLFTWSIISLSEISEFIYLNF